MNRTFKIVFNKARGALMVANEATSSVQKKGTKLVVAAAAAMMLAGGAMADEAPHESTNTAYYSVSGDGSLPSNISTEASWESSVPGNYYLVLANGAYELTAENATFSVKTTTPESNTTQLQTLGVQLEDGASLTLTGNSASISVETNAYGTNHSQTSALNLGTGSSATISATSTTISAKSTLKNGKAVYGVAAGGSSTIKFTGSTVGITIETATDRDLTPSSASDNYRGEAMAIDAWDEGLIETSADTALTISVKGTGSTPTDTTGDYPRGASNVYGIVAEGGIVNLGGTANITVESNAGIAKGIRVTNGAWTNTQGSTSGDGAVTLGGETSITVSSKSGDAYGIDASEFTRSNETYEGSVALTSNGKLTLSVSSETGEAIGIAVNKDAIINLNGETSITATNALSGNGTINVSNTLTANGSLADFTGSLILNTGGSFTLTSSHGELADNVITLAGGTLSGASSVLFSSASTIKLIANTAEDVVVTDDVSLNRGINVTNATGTISVTDSGVYTIASLQAMSAAITSSNVSLVFTSATLAKAEDETAVLVDNVIQATEQVTAEATVSDIASLAVNNSGAQSLIVNVTDTIGSVTLTTKESESTTTFTLVGSDSQESLIQDSNGDAIGVTVSAGVTLQLGLDEESTTTTNGTLSEVTLSDGAALKVNNIEAQVDKLTVGSAQGATVTIGSESNRGSLSVQTLSISSGSTVFLDPAWQNDAPLDVIENASHLSVSTVDTLAGNLVVGRNSLTAIGATSSEAVDAFNKLSTLNEEFANWGPDGVTAALYTATQISVDEGKIVVDGSLESLSAFAESSYSSSVNFASNSLLMVDMTALGGQEVVNGTITMAEGSSIGIVNTSEGTLALSTDLENSSIDSSVKVFTDNPFFDAALDVDESGNATGSVTSSFNAEGGLGAIASAGIQAMTRRADFTFSQTIADRASIDQELQPGVNLWVDVSGENYQMDGLKNGGEFEADVFYGSFGGDVRIAQDYTVGAAFQYGTGSLRSGVSNIKNDIDNYGLALYATAKFGSFKVLGELSYIWGENDITSSQTALNQSVDTDIYSVGVTGMYEFKAGAFSIIPSIGVRVSQLETDAMKVGSVKVEDQDQTLFQIPIALRINGADMAAGGWKLAPSFKIAYVPTFGDKDIDVLGYTTDVIDTAPVQVDFGLRAGKENLMVNAAFELGAGHEGASSVGGRIGLKYAF